MKIKDVKALRSILNGPCVITYVVNETTGATAIKPKSMYSAEDHKKTDIDERAIAYIHQGLSLEVSIGVRDTTTAKELWEALENLYEGNEEMKESRREMLSQKFDAFNHVPGETLESQIQRFVALVSEMKFNDMVVDNSVMNKMLVNILPRSWDSNVTLIKRTKDLARLTLSETISLIKSYDLDDRQRYLTQTASYNNAIIAIPSNALISQQEP